VGLPDGGHVPYSPVATARTFDAGMGLRQRSAAALTHPLTLAGLALFILNDLALKALWPDAWLTGKLSDLGFVVIASPLLAFLLSLAARHRAQWERAAFLVAYAGLPILYAAFNTFPAVHDPIIGTLSLVRGGPTYSPLDLTDSLVIAPGLALALWVWRRPVPPATVRRRLALVVAAVAALASIASSGPETELGVRFEQGSVDTPDGRYWVSGSDVFEDGEVVYSTDHFWEDENLWLQARSTWRLDERELTTRPYGIIVDEAGNVVVGMGIQGVLIRTPDGEWRPTADGRFRPVDFSPAGKFRALFSDGPAWGVALALSTSALVVAILIADFRLRRLWMVLPGLVLAVLSGALWLVFFSLVASFSGGNLAAPLVVVLIAGPISALVMLALAGLERTRQVLQYGLGIAALLLSIAAVRAFADYHEIRFAGGEMVVLVDLWSGTAFDTGEGEENMAMAMAGLGLGMTVVAGSLRRRRHWRAAALAFLGVAAAVFAALLWWLFLDAGLTFAKVAMGVIAALVAVYLGVHLRSRPEDDAGDPSPPPPEQPRVFLSRGRSTPPFLRPR